MADAGGSSTTRRSAATAPAAPASRLTAVASSGVQTLMRKASTGNRKNVVYCAVIRVPSQVPSATPASAPTSTMSGHHREVVQRERPVGVAERLQGGDLLALRGDEPPQDDVQEERGHAEEDRRDRGRHDALLLDLVVEKTVRGLLVPSVGAEAPPGLEQTVELVDDGRRSRRLGASRRATSLNAPSMSNAAARAGRDIHSTPKLRSSGSGSPARIGKTYSGESATPTMRNTSRRPLRTATSWSPGASPWASAKPSLTTTSSRRAGSTRRPAADVHQVERGPGPMAEARPCVRRPGSRPRGCRA